MLSSPTPFPYVGSYALLDDHDGTHLVRIQMRRESEVVVSFPMRQDASGNRRVDPADLIDGTPLTAAEQRAFHSLDLDLRGKSGRTAKQKAQQLRRDALKRRMIYAPILDRLLREINQRKAA